MAEMQIDVDALLTLGTELGTVHNEFTNADTNSDVIANAVGHSGLASTVRDFSRSWDDRREKMLEAIAALSDAATAVAEGWIGLDEEGAAAINGDASTASANAPVAV